MHTSSFCKLKTISRGINSLKASWRMSSYCVVWACAHQEHHRLWLLLRRLENVILPGVQQALKHSALWDQNNVYSNVVTKYFNMYNIKHNASWNVCLCYWGSLKTCQIHYKPPCRVFYLFPFPPFPFFFFFIDCMTLSFIFIFTQSSMPFLSNILQRWDSHGCPLNMGNCISRQQWGQISYWEIQYDSIVCE